MTSHPLDKNLILYLGPADFGDTQSFFYIRSDSFDLTLNVSDNSETSLRQTYLLPREKVRELISYLEMVIYDGDIYKIEDK